MQDKLRMSSYKRGKRKLELQNSERTFGVKQKRA
jgi:hypothetical protein